MIPKMASFNPLETVISKSENLKFRVAIPTETEHHQKTVHGEITCFNNFSRCIGRKKSEFVADSTFSC